MSNCSFSPYYGFFHSYWDFNMKTGNGNFLPIPVAYGHWIVRVIYLRVIYKDIFLFIVFKFILFYCFLKKSTDYIYRSEKFRKKTLLPFSLVL